MLEPWKPQNLQNTMKSPENMRKCSELLNCSLRECRHHIIHKRPSYLGLSYHTSSIDFVYPNAFDEDFDAESPIDDDNIGQPPPNSQPYRDLGVSPIVLETIHLPPQDPQLGIIALHPASMITPRTRMWMDKFGDHRGTRGLYFVYPYYYEVENSKGRMWRRTKGK